MEKDVEAGTSVENKPYDLYQKYRIDSDKAKRIRDKAGEVAQVAKGNIESLLERGETLHSLGTRAEAISAKTKSFGHSTTKVQKALWWESMRMTIYLLVTIVFSGVFVYGLWHFRGSLGILSGF